VGQPNVFAAEAVRLTPGRCGAHASA
jgi:hypothetical protein